MSLLGGVHDHRTPGRGRGVPGGESGPGASQQGQHGRDKAGRKVDGERGLVRREPGGRPPVENPDSVRTGTGIRVGLPSLHLTRSWREIPHRTRVIILCSIMNKLSRYAGISPELLLFQLFSP